MRYLSSPTKTLGTYSEKIAQEILKQKRDGIYYFDNDMCVSVQLDLKSIRFLKNSESHRENLPAVIRSGRMFGSISYYINGIETRRDGPSFIKFDAQSKTVINTSWALNDISFTKVKYFLVIL